MTRQYWANLALCIVMGALVIFAVTRMGSALTPKGLFVSEPSLSHEVEEMMQDVTLQEYRVVQGRDNQYLAEFSIQNKGDKNIKNVSVLCEFFDKEGENKNYLDRELWLLAETIPAMHSLKISTVSKRFLTTKKRALECQITDFDMVKKPAFTLEKHVGGGHGKASETGSGGHAPAGH